MNQDLETQLRDSLRPLEPRQAFTQRMLTQVGAKTPRKPRRGAWWLAAGIAASILLGAGIEHQLRAQRERAAGLEARRQVLQALHVTNQKLDLAYEAVKAQAGA